MYKRTNSLFKVEKYFVFFLEQTNNPSNDQIMMGYKCFALPNRLNLSQGVKYSTGCFTVVLKTVPSATSVLIGID